jgi:hypothetical protein
MSMTHEIVAEVPGLYRIVTLKRFRKTAGVCFDVLNPAWLPHLDGIDRVLHQPGARSPGAVGTIERPWYMHTHQDDNLMVLHGTRHVDLYTPDHGRIETFDVLPNQIRQAQRILYDGPAMLVWPRGVFHRVISCEREGSASVNFAVRYPGIDFRTNFSVYDLDPTTGHSKVIREGQLDQPA